MKYLRIPGLAVCVDVLPGVPTVESIEIHQELYQRDYGKLAVGWNDGSLPK